MEVDKILVDRLTVLIKTHEALVVENTKIVTKYKNTLSQLLGTSTNTPIKEVPKSSTPKQKTTKVKKKTKINKITPTVNNLLKDTVVNLLSEKQSPVTANTLREKYNEVSGKNFTTTNFSPRTAELTRKGIIVKCIIEGNPINTKFMYALPEWMENGNLKQEYFEKAKAGQ